MLRAGGSRVSTAPLGAGHARAAILPSQGLGSSSGSRQLEQRGSAWPPGTRGLQAASSDAGPERGDPLLSAPAAARSAASGEWVRLHSPALAALLCRAPGQTRAWARGSRVIAPAPAPCPAQPFRGALAASLCSRQPSGTPASPAQLLPDVRHGLPRERPAGPGQLRRGLWDAGAPASGSLSSAPSSSDGYRATGSEPVPDVSCPPHPPGPRGVASCRWWPPTARGAARPLRSLALLPHKPPGSLAVLW